MPSFLKLFCSVRTLSDYLPGLPTLDKGLLPAQSEASVQIRGMLESSSVGRNTPAQTLSSVAHPTWNGLASKLCGLQSRVFLLPLLQQQPKLSHPKRHAA